MTNTKVYVVLHNNNDYHDEGIGGLSGLAGVLSTRSLAIAAIRGVNPPRILKLYGFHQTIYEATIDDTQHMYEGTCPELNITKAELLSLSLSLSLSLTMET